MTLPFTGSECCKFLNLLNVRKQLILDISLTSFNQSVRKEVQKQFHWHLNNVNRKQEARNTEFLRRFHLLEHTMHCGTQLIFSKEQRATNSKRIVMHRKKS